MKTSLPFAVLMGGAMAVAAGFSSRVGAAENQSGKAAGAANAAIMAYLGEPVAPPARLDPKYTAEGISAACRTACAQLGFELQKLAVDDAEFPFLVYGVISGNHDFQAMPATLRAMSGYGYGGSVVGRTQGTTYFSLNLMSHEQLPPEQRAAIQRRLMIRLQMLGAVWANPTQ